MIISLFNIARASKRPGSPPFTGFGITSRHPACVDEKQLLASKTYRHSIHFVLGGSAIYGKVRGYIELYEIWVCLCENK